MTLDPITLKILANKVVAATEKMATTLQRTARTLFVKEATDHACTLMGRDGLVLAYPSASGATIFINMDANPTLRCVPDLDPGDVIVTSDPYPSGGMVTHTPDISLLAPSSIRPTSEARCRVRSRRPWPIFLPRACGFRRSSWSARAN